MIEHILHVANIENQTDIQNITTLLQSKNVDLQQLTNLLEVIAKIKLDDSSFLAAILDYVFDKPTQQDFEYVKQTYSQEVFELFASLKQLEKYQTDDLHQAENFRMMLVAISKDIRVIIIKLCGILFALRQFQEPISATQKRYLLQVREIFAPLAERLGLNFMKSELEDLCLKFLEPDVYNFLLSSVELKREENQKQINITKANLEKILKDLKIEGVITYRQKHFSSIHKKMQSGNIPLAKIYDLVAMRVIVNTVEECYAVIGGIHGIYKPIPGKIKDYIANPKPNGYKSLHTTIIAENERPLEIQIRTHEMHKVSEYGIAAHWIYKEKRSKKTALDEKLGWIRSIMENTESLTSRELIDAFKNQLTTGSIFVQTPKGKILEFPENATLLDFAYAIHSDIGNYCVGGKINGKIKPLTTKMSNGDVIEIITSPTSKGPSRDWLNIVATAQAKAKIKYFFRKEYKEEHIRNGRKMVEEEFKVRALEQSRFLDAKIVDAVLERMCFSDQDELFAAVGYGSVSSKQVVNRLVAEHQRQNQNTISNNLFTPKISIKKSKDGILIDGDSGMLVRFANCCSPVLGDEIIAYVSRGKGATIHRKICHNVQFLEQERLIPADWNDKKGAQVFETSIKVTSQQSNSFVQQVIKQIMENKVYILSFNTRTNKQNQMITTLKLQVESNQQLDNIIKLIEKFEETTCVERAK
jgi:GTP pyrophosphokinase